MVEERGMHGGGRGDSREEGESRDGLKLCYGDNRGMQI